MDRQEENSKRRVLDWIGVKKEEAIPANATGEELIAKIKELKQENAELRARKDFQELSAEELESLAAQTAVAILQTVHAREAEAKASANALIESATKQANSTLSAAEKKLSEATVSADKTVLAAQKNADGTIEAANKKAKSLVAEAEAIAKQTRATLDAEGQQIRSEAQQWANKVKAEAEKAAAGVKQEAQQWADATRSAAENQAAKIRQDIAAALTDAREAHKAVADSQDKLMKSVEKQYRLAITAVEQLDSHASEVKAADKPKPAGKSTRAESSDK
jgi:ribosomal protein L29